MPAIPWRGLFSG